MGFLEFKLASLTINVSVGLNWLKTNKEQAVGGECQVIAPSVHTRISDLKAADCPHWERNKHRLSLGVDKEPGSLVCIFMWAELIRLGSETGIWSINCEA